MKKFINSFILYLSIPFIAIWGSGCTVHMPVAQEAQEKSTYREIKDSIGRTVEVPLVVDRIAVANAYNAELVTALGAANMIIGVDYNIFQDQEAFQYRFTERQVIGKDQRNINYEKVIELNPQVLILTGNGGWEEAAKKLEPFGIAVFVCDSYYTDQFFENTRMMGLLLGKEPEANALVNYFASKLDYIKNRLKDVERKTVYFEYRTAGNSTIPGDYFYEMVAKAHGDNVFKSAKNNKINIEEVVAKNPDYIVKVSDTRVYSSYIPPTSDDMNRIRNELIGRPGWDGIEAVKKNHVLLLSHYVHGGAAKLVGTMYIAKFMYPEYLPDLYPEEIFKTWVTKYQGLEYQSGHTDPPFSLQEE